MQTVLLKDYLKENSAISLSRVAGMSTQLISYLKLAGKDNVYVDTVDGVVVDVYRKLIDHYYERIE